MADSKFVLGRQSLVSVSSTSCHYVYSPVSVQRGPSDYKSDALPLSYTGACCANVFSFLCSSVSQALGNNCKYPKYMAALRMNFLSLVSLFLKRRIVLAAVTEDPCSAQNVQSSHHPDCY
eukprot:2743106-Amphidinium_carterae.1